MPKIVRTGLPLWIALIVLFYLAATGSAFASCENNEPCDKCAKDSEFSWNPANQYATARLSRFYSVDDEIKAAYERNDAAALTRLAQENLALAAVYRCNWNYGNAIHETNRYLGLASLREGKIDEAAKYLVLAGKSTGSPQLNSFGPKLDLANELLKQGKTNEVKTYLQDVMRFWDNDRDQVKAWLAAIERGERPELDRMASFKPGFWLLALIVSVMVLPVVVTMGLLYAGRRTIDQKALFVVVALVGGYATLFALNFAATMLMVQFMTAESLSSSLTRVMLYLPSVLTIAVPSLVVFLIFRKFSKPAAAENAPA
jgi:hypothetical protein